MNTHLDEMLEFIYKTCVGGVVLFLFLFLFCSLEQTSERWQTGDAEYLEGNRSEDRSYGRCYVSDIMPRGELVLADSLSSFQICDYLILS